MVDARWLRELERQLKMMLDGGTVGAQQVGNALADIGFRYPQSLMGELKDFNLLLYEAVFTSTFTITPRALQMGLAIHLKDHALAPETVAIRLIKMLGCDLVLTGLLDTLPPHKVV